MPLPRVPATPDVIRLRLEDASGAPLASVDYMIGWREQTPVHLKKGKTDADGVLTEPIPAGMQSAEVHVALSDLGWDFVVSVTSFGVPLSDDGASARLSNLGLLALDPAANLASTDFDALQDAISRYRELRRIPPGNSRNDVLLQIGAEHDKV